MINFPTKKIIISMLLIITAVGAGVYWQTARAKKTTALIAAAGILLQKGEYEPALSLYEKATRGYLTTAQRPVVWYKIGFIYTARQQYAQAAPYLEKVWRRYPASPAARLSAKALLDVYFFRGETALLRQLIAEVSAKYEAVFTDLDRLQILDLLFRSGDLAGAYNQYQKLQDKKQPAVKDNILLWEMLALKQPEDLEIQTRLWQLYQKFGRKDRAANMRAYIIQLKKKKKKAAAAILPAPASAAVPAPQQDPRAEIEKERKKGLTNHHRTVYRKYKMAGLEANFAYRNFFDEEMKKAGINIRDLSGSRAAQKKMMEISARAAKYQENWWKEWYQANYSLAECAKVNQLMFLFPAEQSKLDSEVKAILQERLKTQ
ncbi:MAG: hypothetical protein HY920_05530 [Elusimicrobia bacterium]|nr:hypothetical protein [Elusimicrobiota bacterium]